MRPVNRRVLLFLFQLRYYLLGQGPKRLLNAYSRLGTGFEELHSVFLGCLLAHLASHNLLTTQIALVAQ